MWIRVQHFRSMQIRIEGFDDQEIVKFYYLKIKWIFFDQKCSTLSLGPFLKDGFKFQEILQALKREHPALQNMKFLNFFYFAGHFALLDLDPDSESGSVYCLLRNPPEFKSKMHQFYLENKSVVVLIPWSPHHFYSLETILFLLNFHYALSSRPMQLCMQIQIQPLGLIRTCTEHLLVKKI